MSLELPYTQICIPGMSCMYTDIRFYVLHVCLFLSSHVTNILSILCRLRKSAHYQYTTDVDHTTLNCSPPEVLKLMSEKSSGAQGCTTHNRHGSTLAQVCTCPEHQSSIVQRLMHVSATNYNLSPIVLQTTKYINYSTPASCLLLWIPITRGI